VLTIQAVAGPNQTCQLEVGSMCPLRCEMDWCRGPVIRRFDSGGYLIWHEEMYVRSPHYR